MAMIRPTLILNMDLDERTFSDDLAADLKRAYTHVAAAQVKSHPACEGAAEDVLRLNVKMNRPYWDASVEGAEEQWQGVMPKWLRNMFYKISSNMLAFNRMRAERGEEGVVFSWLELNFEGNLVLAVRLRADSSIPADTLEWVEQARFRCNEGSLGTDIVRVSIPSAASYAAQAAPHTVRREVVEPLPEAEEVAEVAQADEAAVADSVEPVASAEPVVRIVTEVEPFDIDYSVWGVTRADGTVEEMEG